MKLEQNQNKIKARKGNKIVEQRKKDYQIRKELWDDKRKKYLQSRNLNKIFLRLEKN